MRVSQFRKGIPRDKVQEGRLRKLVLKPKFGNKSRKQLLARLNCEGEADFLKTEPLMGCFSTHLWQVR